LVVKLQRGDARRTSFDRIEHLVGARIVSTSGRHGADPGTAEQPRSGEAKGSIMKTSRNGHLLQVHVE
jgi:hypothetical protein